MPDLNLLIKPASGFCNMNCRYCFYSDEISKRSFGIHTGMTLQTALNMISKAFEYVGNGHVTFSFQGGEPTTRGISFFKAFIDLVNEINTQGISVDYSIQTNGLLIDEEWVSLFAENHFLVGLSLDGPEEVHNRYRKDSNGNGTYERVIRTAHLLEQGGVDFNILTVITAETVEKIESIYQFFIEKRFLYQQYIPCLDPVFEKRGNNSYSLSPKLYGDFLIRLFDCWFNDRFADKFVYIHYFESLAGMLLGYAPGSCGMAGICSKQNVIEADGSVFPCDFYCLDDYKLGNINTDSFKIIDLNRKPFIMQSYSGLDKCITCRFGAICHGGCRRDRQYSAGIGSNYYCDSYKRFFEYALPRLKTLL